MKNFQQTILIKSDKRRNENSRIEFGRIIMQNTLSNRYIMLFYTYKVSSKKSEIYQEQYFNV